MSGQIMLTGRLKDTITLLDGENVHPQPIEDELCRSPLLAHVMLIGQDKRTLGALVCLSTEELERRMNVCPCTPSRILSMRCSLASTTLMLCRPWIVATARCLQMGGDERAAEALSETELNSVALAEISKLNRERLDVERYEVISAASVLAEPFSVDNGTLTQTLKLRRGAVRKLYEKEVTALLERLR